MRKRLFLVFIAVFIAGCTPSPRYNRAGLGDDGRDGARAPYNEPYTVMGKQYVPMDRTPLGERYRGLASFYGEDFHGKRTSTGEIYDMYGLTAAHCTLPLNTWVEVRNLSNRRTVIVRVNDRGPFVGDRIIDLSYGAARELHMVEKGIQEVEITVLR
jgi:rare lipoprotein A